MQAEWIRTFEGPLEISRLVGALCEALVHVGVPDPEWEFRRAEVVTDEIIYKFDRNDPRDRALAMCADAPQRAYVVVAAFPADTRDSMATMHADYDGHRTRVSIESGSVHILEHVRDRLE